MLIFRYLDERRKVFTKNFKTIFGGRQGAPVLFSSLSETPCLRELAVIILVLLLSCILLSESSDETLCQITFLKFMEI